MQKMLGQKITSAQNPKIKLLQALQKKSAERRAQGLFVVEGVRELEHCLEAGYQLHAVFHCPDLLQQLPAGVKAQQCACYEVTADLYAKIAYRKAMRNLRLRNVHGYSSR